MNRSLIAAYIDALGAQRRLGLYHGIIHDAVDTVSVIRKLRQGARRLP